MKSGLNEPILDDDYPVFADYFYVVDGKIIRSPLTGTVLDLKKDREVREIRRCDIFGRQLLRKSQQKEEVSKPVFNSFRLE